MTATDDFNEFKKDPGFAVTLKKNIDALERQGVFAYLRERADRVLSLGIKLKPDVNGLIVTSAEHVGYIQALEDLAKIGELPSVSGNVSGIHARYGVNSEELK